MPEDVKTYTQDQLDDAVAERNTALEAKRSELLGEAKAAKDEARATKAQLAEMEQKVKAQAAGITSQELDRMRAEVRADLDKQYAPELAAKKALAEENRRLKRDDVVKAQMAKSGVMGHRIETLFKLTSEDYDLTEDGKPMLRERPGTPIEKYIGEDLKGQYPEFFEGTGSSGGGATRSTSAGGGAARVIPAGADWKGSDAADIASGKAVVR